MLYRKDEEPEKETLNLNNKDHVKKLYKYMIKAGGDTARATYNALFNALYGSEFFKSK